MAECFLPDVYVIGGDEGDDTPTDDNTHLWYRITIRTTKQAYVLIGRSYSWGGGCSLRIDWGDGSTNTQSNSYTNFSFSHTYEEYGDYHIIITKTGGTGKYSVGYSSYSVSGSNEPRMSQVMRIHYGRDIYTAAGNYRYVRSLRKLTFHSDMQGTFGYSNYMFIGSTGITEITLPKGVDSITGDAFRESPLATLILLREGVVSLGTATAFYSINWSLKIYVPDIIWDAGGVLLSYQPVPRVSSTRWFSERYNRLYTWSEALEKWDTGISVPTTQPNPRTTENYWFNESTDTLYTWDPTLNGGLGDWDAGIKLPVTEPVPCTRWFDQSTSTLYVWDSSLNGDIGAWDAGTIHLSFPTTVYTPTTIGNVWLDENINKLYVAVDGPATYKSATNWSTYADLIYPISEKGVTHND